MKRVWARFCHGDKREGGKEGDRERKRKRERDLQGISKLKGEVDRYFNYHGIKQKMLREAHRKGLQEH
jgi:hypothetical protein